jgi:hypothetical protein
MQIIKLIHRRIVARALRKRKNEGHEIDATEMAVDSDDNEDYDEKSLEESFLITNKAVNIFGYLNLLINLNLPFSAIENPSLQAAIKYDKICTKTFMKYLVLTERGLCSEIKKALPDHF